MTQPLPERDYFTEMRAIVQAEFQPGDQPTAVTERIMEKLAVTDPELLHGFAMANARNSIRNLLHSMNSSARGAARAASLPGAFRDRVVNGGDAAGWLSDHVLYPTSPDGAQMPLRLMTADQVRYAADDRDSRASALKMEAAFLRAVAKKVPAAKVVGDVFDEETIIRLRQSIVGKAA